MNVYNYSNIGHLSTCTYLLICLSIHLTISPLSLFLFLLHPSCHCLSGVHLTFFSSPLFFLFASLRIMILFLSFEILKNLLTFILDLTIVIFPPFTINQLFCSHIPIPIAELGTRSIRYSPNEKRRI